MVWFNILGDVIFLIGLVVAVLLFATKKKWFMIMYLISICVYIFTIGFVVDVFDLSKDQILLILAFSAGIMIGAGVYLSKECKPTPAKAKKMSLKMILGVMLPFLIIVGVIIFSVWSMRVSETIKEQVLNEKIIGTCPYNCAADACLFQDGIQVATLDSGINEEAMATIEGISVGHGAQAFDNLIFIVDDIIYVSEEFSEGIGCLASGRVEQNYYVTAGNDNICRLEETFDLRQVTWAVIVDVLASDTSVQLSLISPGGTGVNWGYSENYRALLDTGNGGPVFFSVPDSLETHKMTLCGNPLS